MENLVLDDKPASEKDVESILPDIQKAVRFNCLLLKHPAFRDEIEDMCQQIVVLLIKNDKRGLKSFQERSSFNTWLHAIVKHYMIRYLQRRKELLSIQDVSIQSIISNPTQETSAISKCNEQLLLAAINKLSRRERQLLEYICDDELSTSEVAHLMGMKADSVRRRKHAIVKKLKRLVGQD